MSWQARRAVQFTDINNDDQKVFITKFGHARASLVSDTTSKADNDNNDDDDDDDDNNKETDT